MTDNFMSGFTFGVITGTLVISAWSIYLRDRGRDECDNKLPRTEQCVQVWVAPKEKIND